MRRPAVAIVSTYYRPVLGGAEAAAERLARYLHRRGHPVLIFTKRTSPGLPIRETADEGEIHRIGPIAERSGRGKWAFLPFALAALLRRKHEVDVVCCVDYRGIGIAALAARARTGTPVIFQAQTEGVISAARLRGWLGRLGLAPQGALAGMIAWPIRSVYGRADALACISHDLEREAIASGVPAERVHYLPNPVDCTRFAPASRDERSKLREQFGIPGDAVLAAFVGRLSREKGVLELVRAWRDARPRAQLVIIGPGMANHPWDVSGETEKLVQQAGLADTVRLLGGRPPELVAHWLSVADFAIQPSHFEAMGLAAAEAMASGLPVIASDTGGFRDFIVPEETGLLVPVRDVPALGQAITRLSEDEGLRRRLGVNARRRAEAFDERVVLERFAELIDRLARRPRAGAEALA